MRGNKEHWGRRELSLAPEGKDPAGHWVWPETGDRGTMGLWAMGPGAALQPILAGSSQLPGESNLPNQQRRGREQTSTEPLTCAGPLQNVPISCNPQGNTAQ